MKDYVTYNISRILFSFLSSYAIFYPENFIVTKHRKEVEVDEDIIN